MTTAFEPDQKS